MFSLNTNKYSNTYPLKSNFQTTMSFYFNEKIFDITHNSMYDCGDSTICLIFIFRKGNRSI